MSSSSAPNGHIGLREDFHRRLPRDIAGYAKHEKKDRRISCETSGTRLAA